VIGIDLDVCSGVVIGAKELLTGGEAVVMGGYVEVTSGKFTTWREAAGGKVTGGVGNVTGAKVVATGLEVRLLKLVGTVRGIIAP
jgi:hypothetical protein